MSVSFIPFSGRSAALTILLLAPAACQPSERPHDHAADGAAAQAEVWYCPMHPGYRSDRPGNCPICDMTLVPLGSGGGESAAGGADRAALTIAPERLQLIGVRTGVVEKKRVARTIHAFGRVDVDEGRLSAVTLKYAGFIDELFAKRVGQLVKKGEPLLSLYSPDLYEAQRSYLAAKRSLPADDPTLSSARERLRLLDQSDEQIAALDSTAEPQRRSKVLAPRDGTLLVRNVVEGGAVEAGKELFELADLTSLWVVVDLFADEAAVAKAGQEVTLAIAGVVDPNGAARRGTIEFVYPTLNEATRTVRARIVVDNHDGALKPGMYADATLAVDLGEVIAIDADAVLDTGVRQIVFVSPKEGQFEPREVKLGDRSDGHAVVLSGLEVGERIVTSGNFLIDSESRLRAALQAHATSPNGAGGGAHEHH